MGKSALTRGCYQNRNPSQNGSLGIIFWGQSQLQKLKEAVFGGVTS